MNENIFEGAKFGDKFVTRDGRVAIFKSHHNTAARIGARHVRLWIEDVSDSMIWRYNGSAMDSKTYLDIVSKYKEPIDEDKLDELAINECAEILKNDILYYEAGDECVECVVLSDAEECYKAGYRKAKEE